MAKKSRSKTPQKPEKKKSQPKAQNSRKSNSRPRKEPLGTKRAASASKQKVQKRQKVSESKERKVQ